MRIENIRLTGDCFRKAGFEQTMAVPDLSLSSGSPLNQRRYPRKHVTVLSPILRLVPQSLVFEQRLWEFGLSNDTPQCAAPDRVVKGHRNGYRRALPTLLHDSVAALLPDGGKPVLFENPTNL
jgi:hypothetical protein